MRRIASFCALAALTILVIAYGFRHGGPDRDAVRKARAFPAFPVYWLGDSFEHLPLTAYERTKRPPTAALLAVGVEQGVDEVSLVYGTCHAASDSGCAPPLSIQISAVCGGAFGGDHLAPGPGPPLTHLTVDGVPAVFIGIGNNHLELFSGGVTISIFGVHDLALRAAVALQPANARARALATPGVQLPAPPAGRCA
jgi:hypothetical protein